MTPLLGRGQLTVGSEPKPAFPFAEMIMGSLQQTTLGVICITAAFFFGQYMRTHPSPGSLIEQPVGQLLEAEQGSVAQASSPFAQAIAAQQSSNQAGLPSPSAGFGNLASQDNAAAARSTTAPKPLRELVTRIPKPAPTTLPPTESVQQVDVPDFSELARSFENTPLALPSDTRFETGAPATTPSLIAATPDVRNSSYYQPNVVTPKPRPRQNRGDFVSSRRKRGDMVPPAAPRYRNFAGSAPEAVSPPQPMTPYELKQDESSFRQQDFAPQLGHRDARPIPPSRFNNNRASDIKPQRVSLAPPEPDNSALVPNVPELNVVVPNPNQSATAATNNKHVHSYYDTLADNHQFQRDDFRRANGVTSMTRGESVIAAKPQTVPTPAARPRVPFALNEAGRSELARIRSRQQSKIDLPTERFSQHTTRTGDTLQNLSVEYYGKPDFYLDIYLANQNVLRNPVQIPPGVQLRIPQYD